MENNPPLMRQFKICLVEDDGVEEEYQPRMKNNGKIQRENITGFDRIQKESMVVCGRLEKTIHGTTTAGEQCSLIFFQWNLHQREANMRFKSLRISITFATTRKDSNGDPDAHYHPRVATIAPNGTLSLKPSIMKNEAKVGTDVSFNAGFGGLSAGAKFSHELSQSSETETQITINGIESFNYGGGQIDPDRCNGVEWNLYENKESRSGLPTHFRTAVLLERRRGNHQFTADISTRAKVSFFTDMITRVKRMKGGIPKDDPVIFDPSVVEADEYLAEFVNKLDQVPLERVCRFTMSKPAQETGTGEAVEV